MKVFLQKSLWTLLYLLPAVLFFSYHPVISLGANSSMNFELSLPLIWLVLFDAVAFLVLLSFAHSQNSLSRPKNSLSRPKTIPSISSKTLSPSPRKSSRISQNLPGISDRRIFLFSLFPFYLTLSVFWSRNPLRGLLTAGIVWLLFFAIFAIIFILPLLKPAKNLKSRLFLSLFLSTAAVCVFCFIQSILDACGLPRSETLLCAGCTYRSFGFPHPSGFAIEPQFMGNLLLAPTLTALYLLTFRPDKPSRNLPLALAALLFTTALFFTFSRGAIYAFAVALFILIIFALIRRRFRPSLIILPVVAFLLSLGLQGTFAALGPTSETFTSAVTKSIHQLSLGLIDLRPPDNTPTEGNSPEPAPVAEDLPEPIFDGYVAESTNTRLNLNETALATSLSSPKTFLIGVGLGGAGTAMFEAFPEKVGSPKEIVQNQTFSLLLETGLVGLLLAHFVLILAFFAPLLPQQLIDGRAAHRFTPAELQGKTFLSRQIYRLKTSTFWSHPALPLLLSLVLAYLITLQFFSGLPNALQIYLMPPLLFFVFQNHPQTSKTTPQNFQKSLPPNSQKPLSSQIAQNSTPKTNASTPVNP